MPIITDSDITTKFSEQNSGNLKPSHKKQRFADTFKHLALFSHYKLSKKSICKDLINTFREIIIQFWHSTLKRMPIKEHKLLFLFQKVKQMCAY